MNINQMNTQFSKPNQGENLEQCPFGQNSIEERENPSLNSGKIDEEVFIMSEKDKI